MRKTKKIGNYPYREVSTLQAILNYIKFILGRD